MPLAPPFASNHFRSDAMGLLDSILSGVANNALGRASGMSGLLGGRGGRSNILMALLPVVLTMLANRRSGASFGHASMPGGLGGLGALAGIGGLGALLNRFHQNGYGPQAQSWVGTGPNEAIPPEAVSQVFNQNELSEIASQAGVSQDEARTGLSALLPQIIDHLTPHGQLPTDDQLASRVDELHQEVQQRTI
jgi:uncharacterized protein YidB (DUF937 family)